MKMDKITAYLLDDEANARNTLQSLLKDYCTSVELVGASDNIEQSLKDICLFRPNILFLDIHLSSTDNTTTSFELIEKLPDYEYEVVFITAFEKYAVKAFKANAVDYLLKPVSVKELISAVDSCKDRLKWRGVKPRLDDLLDNLEKRPDAGQRIWIHSMKDVTPIEIPNIIHVEAQGKCTEFHCTDQSVMSSKNLGEYTEMLEDKGFLRVHRSHIINPKWITKLSKQDGGWVIMSNQREIPVSRKSKDKLSHLL